MHWKVCELKQLRSLVKQLRKYIGTIAPSCVLKNCSAELHELDTDVHNSDRRTFKWMASDVLFFFFFFFTQNLRMKMSLEMSCISIICPLHSCCTNCVIHSLHSFFFFLAYFKTNHNFFIIIFLSQLHKNVHWSNLNLKSKTGSLLRQVVRRILWL